MMTTDQEDINPQENSGCPIPPDFLRSLVNSPNFMRLSVKKAAHAAVGWIRVQEIRVSRSFFARCRISRTLLGKLSIVLLPLVSVAAVGQSNATSPLEAIQPKFWNLFDHKTKLTKVASGFGFTEGPVWDPAGYLWVSDETLNKIFKVNTVTGEKQEVIALGDPDGNTYDRQHRLLDCASVLRAVIRLSPDGKHYKILTDHYQGKRLNSPNDVVLGPDGAIYFTDPTSDLPKDQKREVSFQGVYRLGSKGQLDLLTKELDSPNGLAFSPDGKKFYVDDSAQRNIRVYDFQDGRISNGRIFGAEPGAKDEGVPDGMRVDRQGNLYVTGPKGIWVWDPSGHHLGTIVVPEQPANLAWGDSDYSTLYLTATTSVYKISTRAQGFIPYQ
jgi:gluconolactonase